MSGADLYEDGFPHSTKEGYDAGCRGSGCPGALDHGFSCAQAFQRFNGDYGYRKKVEAGMSPSEIVAAEGAHAPAVVEKSAAKPQPQTKPQPEPTALAADAEPAAGAAAFPHGTAKGYGKGCHDGNTCPRSPATGRTCRQAYTEYQREYAVRRRANGGPLGKSKSKTSAPTEAVAAPSVDDALSPSYADLEDMNRKLLALSGEQTDVILSLRAQLADATDGTQQAEHSIGGADIAPQAVSINGVTITITITVGTAEHLLGQDLEVAA
ncbi:MAG: hypothetical protein JWP32_2875 [Schumannella sp.]|nr:hypothetical protein [Schumannella sp.]